MRSLAVFIARPCVIIMLSVVMLNVAIATNYHSKRFYRMGPSCRLGSSDSFCCSSTFYFKFKLLKQSKNEQIYNEVEEGCSKKFLLCPQYIRNDMNSKNILCKFNQRKLMTFLSGPRLIKLAALNYLLYMLSILISYINCKQL